MTGVKFKQVTSVKNKPSGGIAMPGGLITQINFTGKTVDYNN